MRIFLIPMPKVSFIYKSIRMKFVELQILCIRNVSTVACKVDLSRKEQFKELLASKLFFDDSNMVTVTGKHKWFTGMSTITKPSPTTILGTIYKKYFQRLSSKSTLWVWMECYWDSTDVLLTDLWTYRQLLKVVSKTNDG